MSLAARERQFLSTLITAAIMFLSSMMGTFLVLSSDAALSSHKMAIESEISPVPSSDVIQTSAASYLDTKYYIQNLRGDTIDTALHWNLMENERLVVNIVNSDAISQDKLDALKGVILSEKTIKIADSLNHKGLEGYSLYHLGWTGALKQASERTTKFYIPTEFVILESTKGEGDITINLVSYADSDGYAGYTKSITENNQILKSIITIYDVDSLSSIQISTIARHEFGHALGLAHSTAIEDLMAPQITTPYPYISECDIDAINALYAGQISGQTVCKK
jgi:predicted Zn-dependent protease